MPRRWRSPTRPASASAIRALGLDRRVQAIAGGAVVTLAAAAAVSVAIARAGGTTPPRWAPERSHGLGAELPDAERERIRQRDRKRERRMVVDNAGHQARAPGGRGEAAEGGAAAASGLGELTAQHLGVRGG